jgi:hypothetical protein
MLSNRVLQVVGFDAPPLGGGPLGEKPRNTRRGNPDHTAVFDDLDPELRGLPLGIPAARLESQQRERDRRLC